MMTNEDREETAKALHKAAEELHEQHGLDSIEIIATFIDGDGETTLMRGGVGNYHARVGSMRNALVRIEEYERVHARKLAEEEG